MKGWVTYTDIALSEDVDSDVYWSIKTCVMKKKIPSKLVEKTVYEIDFDPVQGTHSRLRSKRYIKIDNAIEFFEQEIERIGKSYNYSIRNSLGRYKKALVFFKKEKVLHENVCKD